MRGRIILVGKAGSGKDYSAEKLKEAGYRKDIGFTTRPPRIGEQNKVNYFFLKESEFSLMVAEHEFYETASFNDWRYGTSNKSWKENQIFIMTPGGISKIRSEDRENCFIVYLDIDEEIRRRRVSTRSDADSVDRRLAADAKDFENFADFDCRITDPGVHVSTIIDLWQKQK